MSNIVIYTKIFTYIVQSIKKFVVGRLALQIYIWAVFSIIEDWKTFEPVAFEIVMMLTAILSLSERCKLTKPCAQTVSKTSLCSILKFFYYCCFCCFCLCLFIENDGIKIPISGTRCKSNFILTLPITFESTQSLGLPRKGTGTGRQRYKCSSKNRYYGYDVLRFSSRITIVKCRANNTSTLPWQTGNW